MNTHQDRYHQIRCEFQEQYKKHIAPFLESKEKEKQEILKKDKRDIIAGFCIAITILFAGILLKASGDVFEFLFTFMVISIIGGFVSKSIRDKQFEKTIKSILMPKICPHFGNLKWFKTNSALPISDTHIIPHYNRQDVDDSFEGEYQNTKFSIYESTYEYESGHGKNRTIRTIFEGILLKIEIHKEFSGNTVIRPSSFNNSNTSGLKKTELEDVVFEKIFDVYTTNEIEARYLITPALMERINNIKKVFEANKIYCSFYKQNLYIGLSNSKDYFKICDMNKPLNDYSQFITMINEIISIYKLIDYLKLTQEKLA